MSTVILSLGANLGDRLESIEYAIERLRGDGILKDLRCSTIVQSQPLGFTEQPLFLNCCVSGTTACSPLQLHGFLREVESDRGRLQRPRWHERELDIDILLVDQLSYRDSTLELPHPRMHERRFVLQPAAELCPHMIHPRFQCSIEELLDRCPDPSRLEFYHESIARL